MTHFLSEKHALPVPHGDTLDARCSWSQGLQKTFFFFLCTFILVGCASQKRALWEERAVSNSKFFESENKNNILVDTIRALLLLLGPWSEEDIMHRNSFTDLLYNVTKVCPSVSVSQSRPLNKTLAWFWQADLAEKRAPSPRISVLQN